MKKLIFIFAILLMFNGISMAQQSMISGKIVDAKDSTPMIGVSIQVKGTNRGTIAGSTGEFSLAAKPEEVLIVSFVGFKSQEFKVGSKSKLEIRLDDNEQFLNEIVVIGSRSANARTNIESPVPVDVITSKEIKATGRTDLSQILSFIAPSINSNRQSGGDGSAHINPVALRGVAPDQTLLLVNGKRRHSSALVNVL